MHRNFRKCWHLVRNLCTFCWFHWQNGIYFQTSAWWKDVRNCWLHRAVPLRFAGNYNWCTFISIYSLLLLSLALLLIWACIHNHLNGHVPALPLSVGGFLEIAVAVFGFLGMRFHVVQAAV